MTKPINWGPDEIPDDGSREGALVTGGNFVQAWLPSHIRSTLRGKREEILEQEFGGIPGYYDHEGDDKKATCSCDGCRVDRILKLLGVSDE